MAEVKIQVVPRGLQDFTCGQPFCVQ
uniref:Uncharacterized protein n=1 Tax=Rhizophora mucronata TaxID=61149 RepID=A0A2P2IIN1_RHIMU